MNTNDIPEFPPPPRPTQQTSIAFDELRTEFRLNPKNNVDGMVRLQMAHHFYRNGVKIVHGNWMDINVGEFKSNYISVKDIQGSVKCRM